MTSNRSCNIYKYGNHSYKLYKCFLLHHGAPSIVIKCQTHWTHSQDWANSLAPRQFVAEAEAQPAEAEAQPAAAASELKGTAACFLRNLYICTTVRSPTKVITSFPSSVGPMLVHLVELVPVLGHLRSERSEPVPVASTTPAGKAVS